MQEKLLRGRDALGMRGMESGSSGDRVRESIWEAFAPKITPFSMPLILGTGLEGV